MKINRICRAFLTAAMSLGVTLPCLAQGYHSSHGGSRVVNQRQNGLQNPSATYIGGGTLSATARGENPNGTAPGLPQVNMGANVRTPGDNVYKPGTIKHQRRGGNRQYQQDYQRQGQNYYVPGQNANGYQHQYRSDLGQSNYPQNNGTFTYSNNNQTTNSNGLRKF